MSDEFTIDVTPIVTSKDKWLANRKLKRIFGTTDTGDHLMAIMPDGEKELEWSLEEIEDFMQKYCAIQRKDRRFQNSRRWNYTIWRYIMELYAEGFTMPQIAEKVKSNFEIYNLPDVNCTASTIKRIIWYRGWHIGQRMKELLAQDRVANILGHRRSAVIRTQELEIDLLNNLSIELRACIQTLKGLDPADKEYKQVVSTIKTLGDQIAKYSGTNSIRKIEEVKEIFAIKQEFSGKDESRDPKQIVPKIYES